MDAGQRAGGQVGDDAVGHRRGDDETVAEGERCPGQDVDRSGVGQALPGVLGDQLELGLAERARVGDGDAVAGVQARRQR